MSTYLTVDTQEPVPNHISAPYPNRSQRDYYLCGRKVNYTQLDNVHCILGTLMWTGIAATVAGVATFVVGYVKESPSIMKAGGWTVLGAASSLLTVFCCWCCDDPPPIHSP